MLDILLKLLMERMAETLLMIICRDDIGLHVGYFMNVGLLHVCGYYRAIYPIVV